MRVIRSSRYITQVARQSDQSIKSSSAEIESAVDACSSVNTIRECDKIQPETLIGFKQEDDLLTSKLSL